MKVQLQLRPHGGPARGAACRTNRRQTVPIDLLATALLAPSHYLWFMLLGDPHRTGRDCADCAAYLDAFDCLCPEACAGGKNHMTYDAPFNIASHESPMTRYSVTPRRASYGVIFYRWSAVFVCARSSRSLFLSRFLIPSVVLLQLIMMRNSPVHRRAATATMTTARE